MKTADGYREFARQCRERAGMITDPNERRATELMASAWDKVADDHEAKLRERN
ncbi:MAG: hypothetical protein WBG12_19875 [Xanthobacteraceae bacterium]|jgi:hypothetical protein